MAQKVIEGHNDTCQHMHLILQRLNFKIRTIDFSWTFSSKYWSRVFSDVIQYFSSKIPRWFKIRRESAIEAKIAILEFELKKVSKFSRNKIEKNEWFEFWAIPKSDAYTFPCFLRWLFDPSNNSSRECRFTLLSFT